MQAQPHMLYAAAAQIPMKRELKAQPLLKGVGGGGAAAQIPMKRELKDICCFC